MNKYICKECGTKYYTSASSPPPSPAWNDGHVCEMISVDNVKVEQDNFIKQEEEREKRMNIIGQNGNDGEHYE
tara:strand:- start:56073 stop:56291 length:219 start_codon:yes stop_codon:yes gene_type:complete